ncbi:hypothetical protein PPOP_3400, partial [Paenibacillus popilliae ATCC 14706]
KQGDMTLDDKKQGGGYVVVEAVYRMISDI